MTTILSIGHKQGSIVSEFLGKIKKIVYTKAKEGRKKGIVCPRCHSSNIDAELHLNKIRIVGCLDCGYSSNRFMKRRK